MDFRLVFTTWFTHGLVKIGHHANWTIFQGRTNRVIEELITGFTSLICITKCLGTAEFTRAENGKHKSWRWDGYGDGEVGTGDGDEDDEGDGDGEAGNGDGDGDGDADIVLDFRVV